MATKLQVLNSWAELLIIFQTVLAKICICLLEMPFNNLLYSWAKGLPEEQKDDSSKDRLNTHFIEIRGSGVHGEFDPNLNNSKGMHDIVY